MSNQVSMSQPPPEDPLQSQRRRMPRLVVVLVGIVLAVAVGAWAANRGGAGPTATVSPGASGAGAGRAAPSGSYTLLDGKHTNLAALRGQPTMVWFVANGCASCAVSIPAVASHLASFTRSGTRVVVLGLYGAFGSGSQGTAALASFGLAAAGPAFSSSAWTWGLASQQLTTAYDPDGVPDAYYLVDAAGRITYQNSVPVSTMGALLAHLPTPVGHTTSSDHFLNDPSSQNTPSPAPPVGLP